MFWLVSALSGIVVLSAAIILYALLIVVSSSGSMRPVKASPTAFPTAIALSGTSYQAAVPENKLTGHTRASGCYACSEGKKIRFIGLSGTLQFNDIRESRTDNYTLTIYYFNGGRTNRTLDISVNGGPDIAFSVPSTGSWHKLAILSVTVRLNAGSNTIKFSNPLGAAPDIDRIVV